MKVEPRANHFARERATDYATKKPRRWGATKQDLPEIYQIQPDIIADSHPNDQTGDVNA